MPFLRELSACLRDFSEATGLQRETSEVLYTGDTGVRLGSKWVNSGISICPLSNFAYAVIKGPYESVPGHISETEARLGKKGNTEEDMHDQCCFWGTYCGSFCVCPVYLCRIMCIFLKGTWGVREIQRVNLGCLQAATL